MNLNGKKYYEIWFRCKCAKEYEYAHSWYPGCGRLDGKIIKKLYEGKLGHERFIAL